MLKIQLAKPQLDKLSDLALGLGQLFFGSTVLPFLIPSLDKPSILVLILGIVLAITLWIFGVGIMNNAVTTQRRRK